MTDDDRNDDNDNVHVHDQPVTLDPNQPPIPDDAPLAQGHTREDAEAVQDAAADHKEAVDAAAEQDDVEARDPGDHAQAPKPKAKESGKK